jgi:hypothetical protein
MIEASRISGSVEVVVRFGLPAVSAGTAAVVGDFNGWSVDANPMLRASWRCWQTAG